MMKIKVKPYEVYGSKGDIRLKIGLDFEIENNHQCSSAAILQLNPIAYLHGKVREEAFGLLYLSAIVYAIDRSVSRHKYSIDGWSREFDVEVKIPEYEKFQAHQSEINKMLSFLTGDYWNCQFVGDGPFEYPRIKQVDDFDHISQVNLFSGGLDSLIGAIDYMAENPNKKLFLSSHYDSKMPGPKKDQREVKKELAIKYEGQFKSIASVMITPEKSEETSCRSRSLMFLSLATMVAEYANCVVIVPENGSVSLNFPLSSSRRASCSTRTTHPKFIKDFQQLVDSLELSPRVINPYELKTKGEMVKDCKNKSFLLKVLAKSNSCGKRGKHQFMQNTNATHCAYCMPCMYRKAALVGLKDRTSYGNSLNHIYSQKDNAISNDFFAMLDFLKKDLQPEDIKRELFIGGMIDVANIDDYVELVNRTRKELKNMLRKARGKKIKKYMGWL